MCAMISWIILRIEDSRVPAYASNACYGGQASPDVARRYLVESEDEERRGDDQ